LGVAVSVGFLWLLTIINIFGVKWGGIYAEITTVGKLIPLLIFILAGLAFLDGRNFTPFIPYGFAGITISIPLFFWSYTGFEAIVMPAEEVKNPSFTIPWSMVLTILISILVYTLIAFVFVGMIDWKGFNFQPHDWKAISELSSPLSDVAQIANLPWLSALMVIGAIVATAGSGGSWVLLQGRMPFAMAQDKLFWQKMKQVHPKWGTPVPSLLLTSFLSTLVLLSITDFPSIALIASVTVIVPYAAAVLALLVLRKTKSGIKRPFKLPCAWLISQTGFILATFLIYWAAWPWTMVGILLMLSGYVAFLAVKKHSFEWKRNLWLPVYLFGVLAVSAMGDQSFTFNNFTSFRPLGLLPMPWDLLVLAVFGFGIFEWAYRVNRLYPPTEHTG
jgi:amino acid transporter